MAKRTMRGDKRRQMSQPSGGDVRVTRPMLILLALTLMGGAGW